MRRRCPVHSTRAAPGTAGGAALADPVRRKTAALPASSLILDFSGIQSRERRRLCPWILTFVRMTETGG